MQKLARVVEVEIAHKQKMKMNETSCTAEYLLPLVHLKK